MRTFSPYRLLLTIDAIILTVQQSDVYTLLPVRSDANAIDPCKKIERDRKMRVSLAGSSGKRVVNFILRNNERRGS